MGAPEHDLSLLSEAPAVLCDLIELIKSVDPEHYEGMASFFENVADSEEARGEEAVGNLV